MYPTLNLPAYAVKLKNHSQRTQIFDRIRKKFVALTPEEWVRQHVVNYLIEHKNFPASRIAIESSLKYNQLLRRPDIVYYDNDLKPTLIVECKATDVKISQTTFDQIARYNMPLRVNYLLVTNGIQHFCCRMEYEKEEVIFLKELPDFSQL
ncbi:MAG: type I restriction enzyme HsdR N-terminal domain-containing protein [Bacteroidetes bacterium]|nr:type I restriction enzyme HsdR N-terminal domain-containing protein [Bacteroidota bacterium]MBK9672265.1 type I restriction enzyme HsdR N-terminal domain-containing protein [Bacteroidota bacterium]MBK9800110.1 type I restriction enzyme HsdR N-terminal domain-containing protein [Bacteroidota bacterium]MBP6414099.1 type I restriction enzyme HsdR N-terminal domain-containing protein [Bacteroidia bacterium]